MKKDTLFYRFVTVALRVALVAALAGALWSVYRRLPADETAGGANDAEQTALLIQLLPSQPDAGDASNVTVELYPVDIAAVRREYASEPRPGLRFDDFLKRRMSGRKPVEARLDQQGQATVMVAPGKWWIQAVLNGGPHNVEWRLPVNVYGRRQTVQLTSDNAYARTKTF